MNRTLFAALLLTATLALPAGAKKAPSAAALPQLSVEQALELAYGHNPSLSAAQARIDQARAQIDQARADKLPQVYAALAGAWQGKEGKLPVYTAVSPGTFAQSGYALNSFEEVYQASLGVQWLIFSSGAMSVSSVCQMPLCLPPFSDRNTKDRPLCLLQNVRSI